MSQPKVTLGGHVSEALADIQENAEVYIEGLGDISSELLDAAVQDPQRAADYITHLQTLNTLRRLLRCLAS